ncbi:MAG: hypothetical protein RMJ98_11085 [Myxococcales bacterium]|nr:hypothetical protein [Polyangiaceae bacterium]MDW8249831.1 hypothetical protein [Myxococcales bacterium]
MSRSFRAFLVVGAGAIFLAACSDGAVEGPLKDLKSAGSLPESRLPYSTWGDSPAPTGARPRDIALEAGWYKRAKSTEKAPTHGDSPSGATPRPIF